MDLSQLGSDQALALEALVDGGEWQRTDAAE
jgi:hypothetical protein